MLIQFLLSLLWNRLQTQSTTWAASPSEQYDSVTANSRSAESEDLGSLRKLNWLLATRKRGT